MCKAAGEHRVVEVEHRFVLGSSFFFKNLCLGKAFEELNPTCCLTAFFFAIVTVLCQEFGMLWDRTVVSN